MTRLRRYIDGSLRCGVFLFYAVALVVFLPLISDLIYVRWGGKVYAAEHGRLQTEAVPSSGLVTWVIDGDTVVIDNRDKVRFLGIDSPEQGEPFYEEAKERNKAIAGNRLIRLEVCKESPRDKYGRLLAYVYVDGVDVGAALLREGLARPLMIPPCGLRKAAEFKALAATAISKSIGIWSVAGKTGDGGVKPVEAVEITPAQAMQYIGKVATVTGKVFKVHETKKAVLINMGAQWRSAFTVVIFKDSLAAFNAAGIDIRRYKGRNISVTGRLRLYEERAEIIVSRPSQLKGD